MQQYGVSDVERLLGLSRNTLRALVAAGFVKPSRGPRNALLFSFQDLIVLRTAQTLSASNLSNRRIARALRELRKQLPDSMPLSGLRIETEADRVVVREGKTRWQAESGQYLLAFEGDPEIGSLSVLEPTAPTAPAIHDDWFDRAVALEEGDADDAVRAYQQAIEADPKHLDARINLGRLLHARGELAHAEHIYREAIALDENNALLWFNIGVLLEDRGRKAAAAGAYTHAVNNDPGMSDAHYNLALLYEELGKQKDAIRHMAQYRRLIGSG